MKHPFGFLATHRQARTAVILIGFGAFVVPFIIYLVGQMTLGPSEAGLPGFLKSLYGSFLQLRPSAWALLLGPYLLYLAIQLTSRPLRRGKRS